MRILILCVTFPPVNFIGSTRPYTWAKYLGRENEVTVMTPKKTIHHGPLDYSVKEQNFKLSEYGGFVYSILNRTGILKNILIKCHYILWSIHVICRSILEKRQYDVVISTYSTWHCHFLGYSLKRLKIGNKWLADYRDSWNNNSHRVYKYKILHRISSYFESIFLKDVDVVTVVSKPMVTNLKEQLQLEKASFHCVYNGFDHQIFSSTKRESDEIIMTHTGSIYPKFRDPSILFQAIQHLIENGYFDRKKLKIRFVGDMIGNVVELARKFNVEDLLILTGQVDRHQSMEYQRDSDFLILLSSSGEKQKEMMTGKVFEYIASGVPILGIGFTIDNAAGELITATKTGDTFIEIEEIIRFLINFKNDKKIAWYNPNISLINNFRSDNQVKLLNNLIQSIK